MIFIGHLVIVIISSSQFSKSPTMQSKLFVSLIVIISFFGSTVFGQNPDDVDTDTDTDTGFSLRRNLQGFANGNANGKGLTKFIIVRS